MVGVFLFHLLVVLLLLHAILLVHALQTFPPLMLLHHLIPLELVVAALVKVLQVFGCLQMKIKHERGKFTPGLCSVHRYTHFLIPVLFYHEVMLL